jgi:hypothetical protein
MSMKRDIEDSKLNHGMPKEEDTYPPDTDLVKTTTKRIEIHKEDMHDYNYWGMLLIEMGVIEAMDAGQDKLYNRVSFEVVNVQGDLSE